MTSMRRQIKGITRETEEGMEEKSIQRRVRAIQGRELWCHMVKVKRATWKLGTEHKVCDQIYPYKSKTKSK